MPVVPKHNNKASLHVTDASSDCTMSRKYMLLSILLLTCVVGVVTWNLLGDRTNWYKAYPPLSTDHMHSICQTSKAFCSPPQRVARFQQLSRTRMPIRGFFNIFKSGSAASTSASAGESWKPSAPDSPRKVSKSGFDVTPLTVEQRAAEASKLTDFQRYVTLEQGTERAFSGQTVNGYSHDNKKKGVYVSAIGGLPLFSSDTKFNSGTGWPSFYAPIDDEHIVEITDNSIPFMPRVEVIDAKSGAHLGHVFPDGPAPTYRRYCINAAALKFIPEGEPLPSDT